MCRLRLTHLKIIPCPVRPHFGQEGQTLEIEKMIGSVRREEWISIPFPSPKILVSIQQHNFIRILRKALQYGAQSWYEHSLFSLPLFQMYHPIIRQETWDFRPSAIRPSVQYPPLHSFTDSFTSKTIESFTLAFYSHWRLEALMNIGLNPPIVTS